MSKVAEKLRQSRESQNLTVYAVAETTKIKTDHIRALEEGRYRTFSAPVYIRGFVKAYATFLKIDPAALLQDLEAELAEIEQFKEPPSLAADSHNWVDALLLQVSKINWRFVLPIFILLLLVGLGIWGLRSWQKRPTKDPLAGLGSGLYQPPANPSSGSILPLPAPATNAPRSNR
jgi:cytoskeletal protein RodZ